MSSFILSCTTCAFRAPYKDELAETFKHGPTNEYRYWGAAGPALGPFIGPWLNVERIKAEATKAGFLGCTEVYSPQVSTASLQEGIASIGAIVAQAEYAVAMESPYLVITGGKRLEGIEGLEATVVGLRELLHRIEGFPLKAALEPHYHSRFRDEVDYDYILGEIDHTQLGVTVDTGHLHQAAVDIESFIHRYSSKIWNVHVKDHIGGHSVPLGVGDIDLRGIIAALHNIGYEGALALEIEPEDPENLPRYVAESHPFLSCLVEDITGRKPE